ncbi:MAG: hypothetical protein M0Q16_06830 [Candidatus Cloacimonetes bacterium]|nr:hypothetical protein [Candidatus Cloacimonadota bacterium]
MRNERITGNDSIMDIMVKLSEGNPGGLTVCMNAFKNCATIDPIGALGGLGPMLALDTLGIYGARIWMLYKDVCHERLPYLLAMLRGWQLGFLSESTLNHAIDNRGEGLDKNAIAAKVCERIPEFNLYWDPK